MSSVLNNNILDFSNFNAFADHKSNVAPKMEFVFKCLQNIGRKKRKCYVPAFSFFLHSVFKSLWQLKLQILW